MIMGSTVGAKGSKAFSSGGPGSSALSSKDSEDEGMKKNQHQAVWPPFSLCFHCGASCQTFLGVVLA